MKGIINVITSDGRVIVVSILNIAYIYNNIKLLILYHIKYDSYLLDGYLLTYN